MKLSGKNVGYMGNMFHSFTGFITFYFCHSRDVKEETVNCFVEACSHLVAWLHCHLSKIQYCYLTVLMQFMLLCCGQKVVM